MANHMTAPDWLSPFDVFAPVWDAGVLTLQRPRTGAWRTDEVELMTRLFEQLAFDPDTRVLVFQLDTPQTGAMDAAHWQQAMTDNPVRTRRALQSLHRWRTHQMKVLPQAVLTVSRGHCCGIDLVLIEGSDVALADESSVFHVDETLVCHLGEGGEPSWPDRPSLHPLPLDPLRIQHLNAQQAQSQNWITFALPGDEVCTCAQDLIRSWEAKDPLALQFTKETLTHVHHMTWDASVNYTAAKFAEIKARQAELGSSSRAQAIAGFLAGQSKPGLKG